MGGSTLCPEGSTIAEKEKLIKMIKNHVKRFNSIPETTTEYYKLVK